MNCIGLRLRLKRRWQFSRRERLGRLLPGWAGGSRGAKTSGRPQLRSTAFTWRSMLASALMTRVVRLTTLTTRSPTWRRVGRRVRRGVGRRVRRGVGRRRRVAGMGGWEGGESFVIDAAPNSPCTAQPTPMHRSARPCTAAHAHAAQPAPRAACAPRPRARCRDAAARCRRPSRAAGAPRGRGWSPRGAAGAHPPGTCAACAR